MRFVLKADGAEAIEKKSWVYYAACSRDCDAINVDNEKTAADLSAHSGFSFGMITNVHLNCVHHLQNRHCCHCGRGGTPDEPDDPP